VASSSSVAASSSSVVTYTVTYNANNGTGGPTTQTKTHDVALTLSGSVPTRTGYTFAGWNTYSNGSGTSYVSGASYTDNADVTLYAQWTANVIYGTSVTYEGETYQTVIIGTQTWMARNLNYNASGSTCNNCATYGRLYDWATAMNLPGCGYGTSCASQIVYPHRGICPSGWHIPSNADWDKLVRYVDGTSGTSSPYSSPTAGRYLKATSGWNSNGNGVDKYGFSALPGGSGYSGGRFQDVGGYGFWWSASEYDSNRAYYRGMGYDDEYVYYNYGGSKSNLISVRCLQD